MENDELMDWLQGWFERFMGRFDRLDNNIENMSGRYHFLGGERFLDNQEVCQLLHVSKRTLQRYRSSGELPYQTIYHKTYYRESDVEAFIRKNFAKGEPGEESKEDSGE
jgi:predicted DNA-binding transcriptional regulator AlpA